VAVCIPAYNEVEGVAATVQSIWDTGYPREKLQIIVAVDGGDARVCAAAEAAGATVVVVTPNQGSYTARNAAADAVTNKATVLLFTDADCIVSPEWITEHLAALEHAPLSGGGVRFVFARRKPRPAEWVDSIRHLKQQLYVEQEGYAATCNLAVTRKVFSKLRFDPSMRTGGDADFGLRAAEAGFTIVYTPAARIDHAARPTRRALFKKVRRVASAAPGLRARRGVNTVPKPRLTLGPWRKARAAGLHVGPVWGIEACLVDFWCQRIVRDALTTN
jgi:GT2 family glycosyltransferase